MKKYLPISILCADSNSCVASFRAPYDMVECRFSASMLQPGEAVVSDCDDYVYAEYANTNQDLQSFNKAVGKFLLLNSILELGNGLEISKIEAGECTDQHFDFTIELKQSKKQAKCSLGKDNQIIYSNEDPISQLMLVSLADRLLTEILMAFKVCYENN